MSYEYSREDFTEWNEQKQRIHSEKLEEGPFPRGGWVWMCSFGVNIGLEQNGGVGSFNRPGAVLKKFNNQMYWVVPLTSKQKPVDFYYNFTDPNGHNVAAIIAQLRLMSTKRLRREMYQMTDADIAAIRALAKSFLEKIETPP